MYMFIGIKQRTIVFSLRINNSATLDKTKSFQLLYLIECKINLISYPKVTPPHKKILGSSLLRSLQLNLL